MRKLYSLLIIAFVGAGSAFAQGDNCTTATSLGTLPAPAACPTENGTPVNLAGTTVGATAPSPYVYLVNCLGAPGNGDDMDAPAADVWYSFTASGTVLDVAITSSMSQMNVALWTGTCASLSGAFCDISATGNLTTTFEPLTPGTTYYMQISGGSTTDVSAFNLTLENYFNCNICNLQSSLTATPPPTNGYYAPGTSVTFCLTVEEWDNISNNWLHGVIPTMGDAWDLITLNGVSAPPDCGGGGTTYTWMWLNSNTSTATGLVTGEGWYVDIDPNGPTPPNGNAGNNFGDPCSITSWSGAGGQFCWSVSTVAVCTGNYDLGMVINTTADGESGSWSSLACTGDPSPAFSATLLCCASIVNAGPDQTICSNASTSLSGSYSNTTGAVSYVWTASPAGALAGLSSTTSLTPTFTPPVGITGPVTFTLAVTDDACTQYDDVIINVTALPTASISYAGPYCSSVATAQSVTLTGTGGYTGGTYSSSPAGLTINASSGAITPSTTTPGTYTVTYTIAAAGGCPVVTATTTVTITAAPTATIDYADPFCTSNAGPAAVTISGTGAYTGGTYSAGAGLTINSGNGNITPSTSTAGSYTVTYTIPASGGCAAIPVTTPIVISLLPTAAIDYADPFCTSITTAQGVTLTGTGAFSGGTYSSTAGLTINTANGSIIPSSSTAGTYTVTYAVPSNVGCPSFNVTTSVVINPVPVFTVSGTSPTVCNGTDGSLLISGLDPSTDYNVTYNDVGTPVGPGVMTSNGSGEIIISGLNAGSYDNFVISYVSTGCPATDPTAVSLINPGAPDVFDIANQILCDVGYQLPAITGTALQNPGYFSGPNGTGTQYFENDIISASALIYIYDVNGACTDQENFTITINTTPTASISYTSPWCEDNTNAQTVTLTGTDAYTGGSYTSTAGLIINSFSGDILPSSSTPGAYVVTYTIPASGGCAAVDVTTNVTITELPTALIDYADPFCTTDATAQVVTASGTAAWTGGTYSAGAGLTIDPVSGDIDASTSTAGVYTVTYTVPASGGCSSVPATTSVTITQGPTAAIDYTDPFCTDFAGAASVSLTGTGAYTGGTYASTAGLTLNASSGDITPSTSTAGSYTVTYTVPASGGCPPLDVTTPVIITALPTALIDYADPFCTSNATAQVVTDSGTAAWTGGAYSAGAGLTIDPVSGDIDASTSTAGVYTVTYTIPASGGCPAVPVTTGVTVTEAPTASISYNTPYCESFVGTDAVTLSGTAAYAGGSFGAGAGLTINASSGVIEPSTSTPGSYTVTYSIPASGGCPSVDVTASVVINPTPVFTLGSTDPTTCNGSDGTITISGLDVSTAYGVSYDDDNINSGVLSLTSDVSGDIVITGLNAGTYDNFTLTLNGCPGTSSSVINLNNPGAPILTNPGVQVVCDSYSLPAISGTALTGNESYWTGTGATGTQLAVGSAITSTQTVYIYDVNGSCSDEESYVVTVNNTPTLTNPGDQITCDSYTLGTITGLNLSGTEAYYDDSQANGAVQISGNITSSQTVWIYDAQGACYDETSFVVTINTTPTITNPDDQTACDSYSLGTIAGTNLSGNEAYYDDSQTNGGVQITGPINASQTVYIYDNIGICSDEESFVVTINNTPVITNPGDQVACANLTLGAITGTNLSGSEAYYNNSQSNGGVQISGPVTSSQTVYVFDSNGGCTDEQSFLVTINPLPNVTAVTGGGTFCEGDPVNDVAVNVTGSPVWIVTYSVDGGAAQTTTGSTSPILLGTAAGVYDILDIEDANCVNTASGTGTIVINNCDFTIPTAITPNADGVHDDWELYGLDAAYPNNVVRIFNRWGGLLYEHDSSVDGPYDSNRWKGDYNGEALPVGSYYYIIELNDEDKKVESGAVSILLEK